jgi:hypothetical protein
MQILRNISFSVVLLAALIFPYSTIYGEDDIIEFAESVNEDVDRRFVKKSKWFYTSFDCNLNQDETMAGIKLGFRVNKKQNLFFNIFYNIRPYKKDVPDNASRTMPEKERNIIGFGLDKFLFITYDFGLYANAGFGYRSNKYLGVNTDFTDGYSPLGGGGLFYYIFDYVSIRLGYQYVYNSPVTNHWGQVSIDFSF